VETDMGYQDDYVMRTISDLVRAIARLALGKNEINYALPDTEDKYSDTDRIYRKLRDLVDAGEITKQRTSFTKIWMKTIQNIWKWH